jgi:hypothetical protein
MDELASMPNVDGMLSFLDTKPEEYARIFGTTPATASTTQRIETNTPSNSVPASNLLPDSSLLPGGNLQPGGSLISDSKLQPDSNLSPNDDPVSRKVSPDGVPTSAPGMAALDSNLVPDSRLLSDSDLQDTLLESLTPASSLLPGGELRTANGRTVRIRVAKSVQDAHTPAEHMLLTAMWKKASAETQETRLLKAGLAELSRWTGSHKTRCRQYLRSLVLKLAIEEAMTFNAAAGKEGARVYRIFSFTAILERRRMARLTHVIRTGAVSFVDPQTGRKLVSTSRLLPDSNLLPVSSLYPDSFLPSESGRNLPPIPGSNLPPLINGALITQIPKCFEGASFQRYRELEQQRREAAAEEERRFKAQQQAVLDDANASDEDKEWARQILGLEKT